MNDDPVRRAMSQALYEAMCAYTKEHKRIRAKGADKVNARCLSVAIDAYNKKIAQGPDEDLQLIEDDTDLASMSEEEAKG